MVTALAVPDRIERSFIPDGDAGTIATVRRMARLVITGATDPLVRDTASTVVAGVSGREPVQQAQAIRRWLASHFQFLRDPHGAELLHSPRLLLTWVGQRGKVQADCDDAAILGAALARAIGLKVRFVVVGFLAPSAPFRHVWAEASASSGPHAGEWVEFDVTRQAQAIPWDKISRTRFFDPDRLGTPLGSLVVLGVVAWLMAHWDSIFSRR